MNDNRRAWFWAGLIFVVVYAVSPPGKTQNATVGNVDERLQLAHEAAWAGDAEQSEKLARSVVAEAPTYWDAYLLLARLAGWAKKYDQALQHLESILAAEPDHRAALLFKLDILVWKNDTTAAQTLLKEVVSMGHQSAELAYVQAQLKRQQLLYLSAYAFAKDALKLDSFHKPSKQLIEDTRIVTVHVGNEFEYFDFPKTPTGTVSEDGKRYGYGLSVAGQAWARARVSGTIMNTFRYRYQTVNNQVGAEATWRVTHTWELTLRGMWGAPAVVVPKHAYFLSVRKEFPPWVDVAFAYALDILPWPEDRPAVSERPSLTVGVKVHEQVRLGGTYTLGLLHYCGRLETETISHSGRAVVSWLRNKIGVHASYGYGEEQDKSGTSVVASGTCAGFDDGEDNAEFRNNSLFGLIGIRIHDMGLQMSWEVLRTLTLRGGYSLQLRQADSNDQTIPAHIFNLGGAIWF